MNKLTRFLVIDSNRPQERVVVYARNHGEAGIQGAAALYAKSVLVYTTHEDGSAKTFVARLIR